MASPDVVRLPTGEPHPLTVLRIPGTVLRLQELVLRIREAVLLPPVARPPPLNDALPYPSTAVVRCRWSPEHRQLVMTGVTIAA
ncbi:hypothetical protein LY13_004436 [Prauserella aidingensis]|nr:hypothetical protein [Prauserella aidingensis]